MPIIKSAIKKMHRDERKRIINLSRTSQLKTLITKARESKQEESIRAALSAVDKAAKKHLIHRNTAARKKSQLAKLIIASENKTKRTPKLKAVKKVKKSGV